MRFGPFKTTMASAALAAMLVVGGCRGVGQSVSAGHGRLSAPLGSISVCQLAGRLDLTISENSRSMATLTGPQNVVVLYPSPGGGAYVNGRPVPLAGEITPVGDMLFVPEMLAGQVRSLLRRSLPPAKVDSRVDPPPPAASLPGGVVVIDPGHGGKDPGTMSASGMREKTVVLDAALAVAESLRRRQVPVTMTRAADRFIELNDRAELANRMRARAFVSIHADYCANPAIGGFTVYVARSASAESLAMARAIDGELRRIGIASRGIRRANYRVLVRTTCPAVLVELGYMSNAFEASKLARRDYRRRLAGAISNGIIAYRRGQGR